MKILDTKIFGKAKKKETQRGPQNSWFSVLSTSCHLHLHGGNLPQPFCRPQTVTHGRERFLPRYLSFSFSRQKPTVLRWQMLWASVSLRMPQQSLIHALHKIKNCLDSLSQLPMRQTGGLGPVKNIRTKPKFLLMLFLLVLPLCFETKAHYEAQSGLKFTTV